MNSVQSLPGNLLDVALPKASYLGLAVLLVLLGCAAPRASFQSQKDASYEKRLERLLLVYKGQTQDKYDVVSYRLGADFSDRLAKQIASLLARQRVPCELVCLMDQLDINVPIKEAASRFGAKQYLCFGVKYIGRERMTSRTGQCNTVVLQFTLWDDMVGKTVWRTEATFSNTSPLEQDADQLLVQELFKAGLL